MRSPGDSRHGLGLNLSLIARPDDPRLVAFSVLMDRVFADPNSVLSLERLREFLTSSASMRTFHVLVAEDAAHRVEGGSVFSYVPRSRCGFSEYLLLEDTRRGRGLGRQLFDHRKSILDADASPERCRGIFIEVDNPVRTPPDLSQQSTLNPYDRLRIFAHLGFRRVDIPYIQPPLGPGKQPVDHMDLLFANWFSAETSHIPTDWILDTLEPIWSAWSPDTAPLHLADLRQRSPASEVALLDPLSGLHAT